VLSGDVRMQEKVVAFGPFQLFRSKRVLLEGDKLVRIGDRALDILIALVDRAGEIVSKKELMNYAWPNTVVEDNNLRVHVAAVRKMLGDGHGRERYIVNVAGRGYKFIAAVNRIHAASPVAEQPESRVRSTLPAPLTRIVGRDDVIKSLIGQLPRRRLVTIVGPGGIGKTTVAIAAAEQVSDSFQRVCFVDLSTVEDPSMVLSVLQAVLGISAVKDDLVASLVAYLVNVHILIVLDNCEHVIECATELVERIIRATTTVTILATSREPLLAEGEQLCNLEPLQSPSESERISAELALSFPAVQLFVERAMNGFEHFDLTDSNVSSVADICRGLDGIPLAIELVAARASLFGVHALSEEMGDDLLLTTKGRRTARSRHQSLRATYDWSYKTLEAVEQLIFRRLSVFKGLFSVDSAVALVSGRGLADADVLDSVMSLVGKSLLTADLSGDAIRYRFLRTTRAYASEQLAASDELAEMLRRHAEHVRALLEGAIGRWHEITRQEWLTQYGSLMDDVRSALEWAFAPGGNVELGAALTVGSLPFGFQFSLIDESRKRAVLALEALAHMSPAKPLWELRINNFLGSLLYHTGSPKELVMATIGRAHTLAQKTGVPQDSIEPLISLASLNALYGDFEAATAAIAELDTLSRQLDDLPAILLADRVGAQVYHLSGDHVRARLLAERVLRYPQLAIPLVYGQTPVDRQVSMRVLLSRLLWLEGLADQAEQIAAEAVQLAALDSPTSMCQALGLAACPIAFWRGDAESASRLTKKISDYSRRYNFDLWTKLSACYEFAVELCFRGADIARLDEARVSPAVPEGAFYREMLCTIHPYWIDETVADRARKRLSGWATAEILRLVGALHLHGRAPSCDDAESYYRDVLQLTREQHALAWELRTVTDLARLLRNRGRKHDALEVLWPVYSQFSEGMDTTDLVAARELIQALEAES
jgi:predicted ATPase/DNA-binding winged helix-turn-helix (wHTH) protein